MPDLACAHIDDYVARAIAIAQVPGAAAELRRRLRANRDSAVLFDEPLLVKSLEALYDRMWDEFRTGNLPSPDLTNLAVYEEMGRGLVEGHEGESIAPECHAAALAHWTVHEPLPRDGRLLLPIAEAKAPRRAAA
jgi:hypothetical protein